MGGRQVGLGQGPGRVPVHKCQGLCIEWTFLCFPRKAVQASMCNSGQLAGDPARCGSDRGGWDCHLEGDICFVGSKALVAPLKRLLDLQ